MTHQNPIKPKSKMPTLIFQKPLFEYVREFWLLIFLYAAIPTIFEIILNFIHTGKLQGHRVGEVVKFIHTAKPIWFAIISFLVSKKLFSKWNKYKKWTFLQGIVIGVTSGIMIGIFLSAFEFTITFFQGDVVDSIIALLSFLWNSWQFVFTVTVFILIFLAIYLVINNFSQIKEMVSSGNEEIYENNSDEEKNSE